MGRALFLITYAFCTGISFEAIIVSLTCQPVPDRVNNIFFVTGTFALVVTCGCLVTEVIRRFRD